MKHSPPPLFSVPERLGVATITMLLLNCVVVFIAEASRNSASNSPIYQGYLWILSLMGIQPPSFEELRLCLPLLVGCAVYYFSRRSPQNVGKFLAWVAGANLLLALYVTLRVAAEPVEFPGFNFGFYEGLPLPDQISGLLLVWLIALALVCTAGEWIRITQERSLDAEVREAERTDEKAAQRLRRRRQLLLASAGPRVPVWLAFDRFLAQLIIPLLFCAFIYREPWDIEKELPVPKFETSEQRRSTSITPVLARIGNDGAIYLNDQPLGKKHDRRLADFDETLQAVKNSPGRPYVLVEVEAGVQLERLIDFVNAAHRVRCPIRLAEQPRP